MAAIKGLGDVLRNLSKEISKIEGASADGLLEAAVFVQGKSIEIVPHDQGVLIKQSFSDVDRDKLISRVGYTTEYAPYVHEMPATFNYTKPGTGPKFLERPVKENTRTILKIIADRAKIK